MTAAPQTLNRPTGDDLDPSKIAIIVPTYNAEATVERALRSALSQIVPEGFTLEIITVDDCSTDRTAEIAKSLQDKHDALTCLQQDQNGGPSAARNRALAATNAAWFTPLDCDDFMTPSRVSNLMAIVKDGGWEIVADNLLMSFEDTPDTPERPLWPGKPEGQIDLSLAKFVEQNLNSAGSRCELGFLKPLIDRRALAAGPVYRGDMRFGEDYDLYTRLLAQKARFCLVDPLGYYAVQQKNSLSRSQKTIDFQRLIDTDHNLLRSPDLSRADVSMIQRHLRESQNEWVWLRAIDAVKARRLPGLVACFFVTPSASWSLIGKLFEQLVVRTRTRLSGPSSAKAVS